MQIVINIPETTYNTIMNYPKKWDEWALNAIKHGTPLPKGHGRLIDADKLKLTRHDIHVEEIDYYHRCVSIENIDNAPTIIEADAEREDKK
jgi:hypothetical protein